MILKFLPKREVKRFDDLIEKQWGSKFRLADYGVLFKEKTRKIYIVSRDIDMIIGKERLFRIDSAGLYFGELTKWNLLRLSIEGSQLVGKSAKKNVVEFNAKQIKEWIKGEDVEVGSFDGEGFALVKHESDFYGCGRVLKKNGKTLILNFVPKARRIKKI
ncbi:MAG TPA: hypothetical protein ENG02_00205 [Candidatus Woesearchaeota archaeon]|nr:hypothetical protein [Candidatus Woesearchaeota archaeon]